MSSGVNFISSDFGNTDGAPQTPRQGANVAEVSVLANYDPSEPKRYPMGIYMPVQSDSATRFADEAGIHVALGIDKMFEYEKEYKEKNYILDVAKRERREAQRLGGVATDGYYLVFVRRVGDGWSDPEIYPVNKNSVENLLRLLFSLAVGAALVPENLVEDFGPRTWRAQKAVRALYRALHTTKHPLVARLFEQWRVFFSEATDYKEWADRIEGKEEFRGFVKGMGLDPRYAEAPRVFFALHTYYALLIKLVASLAAARFAGASALPLSELAAMDSDALKQALSNAE